MKKPTEKQIEETAMEIFDIGSKAKIESLGTPRTIVPWDILPRPSKDGFRAIARWHLNQINK